MAKVKKAPIGKFEEYIKRAITNIENIRTKQEQKQAVLDEYSKQHRRYADGKISRRAYEAAMRKNKALLSSIDSQIKSSINSTKRALQSSLKITSRQVPVSFKVSMDGLTKPAKRVLSSLKNKVTRKKPVRRRKPKKTVRRPKGRRRR